MKTSELTGKGLDHWVAKAWGWGIKQYKIHPNDSARPWWFLNHERRCPKEDYSPTTNWEQCGVLIEKFKITTGLVNRKKDTWFAIGDDCSVGYALDPRIAICRAVVASVFGDEVSNG